MITTFMTVFGLFSAVVLPYVAFRRMLTKLHAELDYKFYLYATHVWEMHNNIAYETGVDYAAMAINRKSMIKQLQKLMFDIVYMTYPMGFHVSRQIRDEELTRLRAIQKAIETEFDTKGDLPVYTSYENYATSSNKHRFLFRLTRPVTLIGYRMWKVIKSYFDLNNRTPFRETWFDRSKDSDTWYGTERESWGKTWYDYSSDRNGYQPEPNNKERSTPPTAE